MKSTQKQLFSNGTEYMNWTGNNCANCIKSRSIRPSKRPQSAFDEDVPNYRCSVEREIDWQMLGNSEVSQRSYDTTHNADCPFKQTEYKRFPRRRKVQGIGYLFEDNLTKNSNG